MVGEAVGAGVGVVGAEVGLGSDVGPEEGPFVDGGVVGGQVGAGVGGGAYSALKKGSSAPHWPRSLETTVSDVSRTLTLTPDWQYKCTTSSSPSTC